jgi:hypothetical protein
LTLFRIEGGNACAPLSEITWYLPGSITMTSNKGLHSILAACSLALLLFFAAFAASGCEGDDGAWVLSLQPSFIDPDLEWDPQLVGTWLSDDSSLRMTFTEGEKRAYKLLVVESDSGDQKSGEFDAHLVRLGSDWFLDLFPTGQLPSSEFTQMHLLRAHSIARVELHQDSIHLAFLSGSWLKKQIKQQVIDVSYRESEGALLLTGTTDEIQSLIHFHSDDDGAFSDEAQLFRQKEQE